jgi:predicted kinase/5-methylcytosine-specific restriction endonuclease McrA
MTRMNSLGSRVASLGPRLAPTRAEARRQYDGHREAAQPWRRWYHTADWRRLRAEVIEAAGGRCERTGVELTGKHPAPNSPVCDHIVPHDGDARLFWARSNLQCVSKRWHDQVKQAREKAHRKAAFMPEWMPRAQRPVTLIFGPPFAGKSTLARNRARAFAPIIELDACAEIVSGHKGRDWDRERWLNAALFLRNMQLAELAERPSQVRAFVTMTEPRAQRRAWWEAKLGADEVIVIATPLEVLEERASGDRKRLAAGADWWRLYRHRDGETVLATA